MDNVEGIFFTGKDFDRDAPVPFINDDIKNFNKFIGESRYFYTQVKEEGIILYNSGKYKLSRRRKLNFDEIKEQAQEYFDKKMLMISWIRQNTITIKENINSFLFYYTKPVKIITMIFV